MHIPNEVFTTMRVNPLPARTSATATATATPAAAVSPYPSILTQFLLPSSLESRIITDSLISSNQNKNSEALEQHLALRIPLLHQHLERLPRAASNLCQTFPDSWSMGSLMEEHSDFDSETKDDMKEMKEMEMMEAGSEALSQQHGLDLLFKKFPPRIFQSKIIEYLDQLSDDVSKQTLRLRLSLDFNGKMNITHGILSGLNSDKSFSNLPKVKLDPQPLILNSLSKSISNPSNENQSSEILKMSMATLRNKTSSRDFYSDSSKRVGANYGLKVADDSGCFDVILWSRVHKNDYQKCETNELEGKDHHQDLITESSIANILLEIPSTLWNTHRSTFTLSSLDCELSIPNKVTSQNSISSSTRGLDLKSIGNPNPNSKFLTPKLRDDLGFLPGLMRTELLELGVVQEVEISVEAVKRLFQKRVEVDCHGVGEDEEGGAMDRGRLYLCNALRGVWEVELDL